MRSLITSLRSDTYGNTLRLLLSVQKLLMIQQVVKGLDLPDDMDDIVSFCLAASCLCLCRPLSYQLALLTPSNSPSSPFRLNICREIPYFRTTPRLRPVF